MRKHVVRVVVIPLSSLIASVVFFRRCLRSKGRQAQAQAVPEWKQKSRSRSKFVFTFCAVLDVSWKALIVEKKSFLPECKLLPCASSFVVPFYDLRLSEIYFLLDVIMTSSFLVVCVIWLCAGLIVMIGGSSSSSDVLQQRHRPPPPPAAASETNNNDGQRLLYDARNFTRDEDLLTFPRSVTTFPFCMYCYFVSQEHNIIEILK